MNKNQFKKLSCDLLLLLYVTIILTFVLSALDALLTK